MTDWITRGKTSKTWAEATDAWEDSLFSWEGLTPSPIWLSRNLYLTTESGLIITTEDGKLLSPYGADNSIWTNRIKPI